MNSGTWQQKKNPPALNRIVKVIWSHIDKVNVKASSGKLITLKCLQLNSKWFFLYYDFFCCHLSFSGMKQRWWQMWRRLTRGRLADVKDSSHREAAGKGGGKEDMSALQGSPLKLVCRKLKWHGGDSDRCSLGWGLKRVQGAEAHADRHMLCTPPSGAFFWTPRDKIWEKMGRGGGGVTWNLFPIQ